MKILLIAPDPIDATSFYRGAGPLIELAKRGLIQFQIEKRITWYLIRQFDLVMMQRPWGDDYVKIAHLVKDYNIPLVLDYDDGLDCVPVSNPSFWTYQKKEPLQKLYDLADKVIVSTESIANRWGEKCVVVPNGVDPMFEQMPIASQSERANLITWRGSRTHEADVIHELPAITDMIKARPDTRFRFIGYTPACIAYGKWPNVDYQGYLDIHNYMKVLCRLKPEAHIVPLEPNEFNRSKSNIAWIEATIAGARVLASDGLPEFEKPGIGSIREPESGNWQQSYQYMMDNLRLSVLNNKRMEVFNELRERSN